jgi:hypothetical protein
MTNGEAPKKKGLPTLAWIGIGCGVLMLVVVAVLVAGGLFFAKKVHDVAGDLDLENPGLATAQAIVRLNPDLEEVSVDAENGTMTIRHIGTGEEITVDFEAIKEGRLSWTMGDQEVTVDASGGDEGTIVKVQEGEETWKLTAGAEAAARIPEWVPEYPGVEPQHSSSVTRDGGIGGTFQITSDDAVSGVISFYRSRLEEAGFDVSVNTFSGSEGEEAGVVNGRHDEAGRTVAVMVGTDGEKTTASVTYNEGE